MSQQAYHIDIDIASRVLRETPYSVRDWYKCFMEGCPLIYCGMDLIEEVERLGGVHPVKLEPC